jgi:hypothetical protein
MFYKFIRPIQNKICSVNIRKFSSNNSDTNLYELKKLNSNLIAMNSNLTLISFNLGLISIGVGTINIASIFLK